jgi:hypothetical protein
MAVPITGCNFVVQWDEDESEWLGMVVIPPREEVLVRQGESPEQVFMEILALARYVLILQDGSAGILKASGLVEACETLLRNCNEAETFLAQQEEPHDTVNCLRGIVKRILPRKGPPLWHVLPLRDKSSALSYVVTTQRVHRRFNGPR